MQKFINLILALIIGINATNAYELVLPKEKKMHVSTNYAFFVGKAKKSNSVTINDEKIYVAPNGAFAHSVKLKEGENRIILKSGYSTHVYKFYKTTPVEAEKPKLTEFEPRYYTVIKDNTPMRNTPIDYGMNRIAHLYKDTNLIINGEKNNFYRVFLSKNKEGWIAKDSVTEIPAKNIQPTFITMNSETFKNASVNRIEFTEKLPYTVEDTEKEIMFKVYNPFVSDNSVYTLNIKKPEKYSYSVNSSNGIYVIKVTSLPYAENNHLEDLNITIDAGHGGNENGTIGCLGDKEKDINLKIALELKNILEQMGANVFMTRDSDCYVALDERTDFARENCTNIFISIHLNSIPDIKMDINKNRGTTVYYYNKNSKELAKYVEENLTAALKTKSNGIKTASFAVIRPTDYVSILVEAAFMTNPLDSMLYETKTFPKDAATGIANGIIHYINSDK